MTLEQEIRSLKKKTTICESRTCKFNKWGLSKVWSGKGKIMWLYVRGSMCHSRCDCCCSYAWIYSRNWWCMLVLSHIKVSEESPWSRTGIGTEGLVGYPKSPITICHLEQMCESGLRGHSTRWTNTTSGVQSYHNINDVLLVSSQKPQSQ